MSAAPYNVSLNKSLWMPAQHLFLRYKTVRNKYKIRSIFWTNSGGANDMELVKEALPQILSE